MKYSEKLQLLMKGVKMDEIKALEEQEAAEALEEAKAKEAEDEANAKKEQSALELAQSMIKDLEDKLEAKDDELTKLNLQFAELNNKQTIKEQPEKETASDVISELFNRNKKEE